MDGTYLTCIRTGAAGAVAAKYLSREDSQVAGFVGCDAQARAQLFCLLEVRHIRKIKIWQFPKDADAPGKQKINPEILKQSTVVVDDWIQASHSGEMNVPLSRKQITKREVHAQMGDIVTGKKRGRISAKEITLFDATGLAIQDISCADIVFQSLKSRRGIKSIRLF